MKAFYIILIVLLLKQLQANSFLHFLSFQENDFSISVNSDDDFDEEEGSEEEQENEEIEENA